MTEEKLKDIETAAKAASKGTWERKGTKILSGRDDIPMLADFVEKKDAEYAAVMNPKTALKLVEEFRALLMLVDILTNAASVMESSAFFRSCFDSDTYEKLCGRIPELREKAGLPQAADRPGA